MNMLFIDDSVNTTNDFIQKEILVLLNVYMLRMTADKVICVCRTGAYMHLLQQSSVKIFSQQLRRIRFMC